MFFEVELIRNVAILSKNLDKNGLTSQRSIVFHLLKNLLIEKASKVHGYFLAVTSIKNIGRGEVVDSGNISLFPVVFNCRTFIPIKGEILDGVVHHVFRLGVCLRCGPMKYVFLSARKMPDYQFVSETEPYFINNELSRIERGVVVRFVVLSLRWIEKSGEDIKKDFVMLASLEGDFLGPVSLSGSNESEL